MVGTGLGANGDGSELQSMQDDADGFVAWLARDWEGDWANAGTNAGHRLAQALVDPQAVAAMREGWRLDLSSPAQPRIVREGGDGAAPAVAADWAEACLASGVEVPAGARVTHRFVNPRLAMGYVRGGMGVTSTLCTLAVNSDLVTAEGVHVPRRAPQD